MRRGGLCPARWYDVPRREVWCVSAAGCGHPAYGCVARSAVKRGVGDAAPYAPFINRIP